MNIIVNKLKLPCDINMEIMKYCYDDLGYTQSQRECINKLKENRRNKFMKLRHKLELAEWYKMGVALCWLKPDGVYGKNNPNGKKDPKKVYGGGTFAETQYFRFYNGITSSCKTIDDPENDYIEKLIEEGDSRRGKSE